MEMLWFSVSIVDRCNQDAIYKLSLSTWSHPCCPPNHYCIKFSLIVPVCFCNSVNLPSGKRPTCIPEFTRYLCTEAEEHHYTNPYRQSNKPLQVMCTDRHHSVFDSDFSDEKCYGLTRQLGQCSEQLGVFGQVLFIPIFCPNKGKSPWCCP